MKKSMKATAAFLAVLAALLFATGEAPAQDQTTQAEQQTQTGQPPIYDMEKAVYKALQDNPQMSSAAAAHSAAEYGVKSSEGALLPSLSTGYGYTRRDHKQPNRNAATSEADLWTWTVNVHQDLFTGWNLLSTRQKAILSKDKAEASMAATKLSLISQVQEAFLGLLKAREAVRSAEDSVARLDSQLKVTQAFYDVGLKPRLDVLQAEVDLASARDSLLQAKNSLETQQAQMNTLLNLSWPRRWTMWAN